MEHIDMIQIDQNLLEDLPLGLLLIDRQGRISWLNRTMGELLDGHAADITGKRLAQLPQAAQQLLATEPGLFHDQARRRWVRRKAQRNEAGERLLVLTDVTAQEGLAEDNARLRQQVQDLTLTDELTGLPNKRAISQALDLHVSRSRRYQNPLSTVLVHVDMHKLAGVQPMSSDPLVLAVSRFLRDRLRWVDQIARWEENLFLLVLPETAEDDARGLLDKIRAEQDSMLLPESYADLRPKLTFGLGCWHKGDDMRTLLRKSLDSLREDSGA